MLASFTSISEHWVKTLQYRVDSCKFSVEKVTVQPDDYLPPFHEKIFISDNHISFILDCYNESIQNKQVKKDDDAV